MKNGSKYSNDIEPSPVFTTGLLASEKFDLGYVTRESNKGWLTYKKEGNKVNYTEVNRNKYLNYTATSKSLTFTNLLEQLES